MVDLEYQEKGWTELSINHEAVDDLDSSNAFEGPEKLLEVWFSDVAENIPSSCLPGGLKAVPEERWKEMLDLVHCKVLSVVRSEHVDAYLLSESSMFVFPHKLILKTCGTTTLLLGLPELLEIAATEAGFPLNTAKKNRPAALTYRVFYSRKSFMFPDKQMHPHKSWKDEVICLDRMFKNGSAYMVGKMNGEHWYLYLTAPDLSLTPPASPTRLISENFGKDAIIKTLPANGTKLEEEDETLEILMTDLDPTMAKQFYLENATEVAQKQYYGRQKDGRAPYVADKYGNRLFTEFESSDSESDDLPVELTTEGHALGTVVAETCGLVDVYPRSKYPDARVDSYLFTPCGFSANAVVPSGGSTHYFTVHVTPEPHCSYASFETNVPGKQSNRETAEVIEQVVSIFRPGRFSVTLFEARPVLDSRQADINTLKRAAKMDNIKGYRRVDRIVHDLDGYDLVFRYYERNDWVAGRKKRLGEALYYDSDLEA